MILDFIRDNLNGDTWENWCDACYRDRYQGDHFVKVPADHKGDAGIEGFTLSGVVYQCYCPDKNYTVNELYEHLRDKVTTDIAKLIKAENAERLKKLGVPKIKEWHFVIPEYPDKRIVEHLEEKRKEVLAAVNKNPDLYSYIDPGIRLIPKTAEDFKVEFVRLIRNPLVDLQLNSAIKSVGPIDWTQCPSEKISNIKRKMLAIMKTTEDDEDFQYMVQHWAECYLKGIEIMNKLHESCGAIYEELFALEQQHKKDVAAKSRMNPDRSLNHKLTQKTPKIVENFDELQAELDTTEEAIASLSNELETNRRALLIENDVIRKLEANLQAISIDLQNNKDAQKLKKMGSDLDVSSFTGKCPVCGQTIQDSLLPIQNTTPLMSIEDNIHHLESQRAMVLFALTAHKKNRDTYEGNIQALSGRLFTLRRLAKSIRSDLYSVDDGLSETVVYERINIENRIQTLKQLITAVESRLTLLKELSISWAKYVADKQTLPRTNFTDSDAHKVHVLETNFKRYLRAFNYKSVSSYDTIQISKENYLPTSEGFDMKFDSSASDNIRAIWAYTLALLRTSNEVGGNHPQIVMFDEPGQHSIVTHDMVSLFSEIIGMAGINQVILGITLNDAAICKAVEEIKKKNVRIIDVGEHAFQKH